MDSVISQPSFSLSNVFALIVGDELSSPRMVCCKVRVLLPWWFVMNSVGHNTSRLVLFFSSAFGFVLQIRALISSLVMNTLGNTTFSCEIRVPIVWSFVVHTFHHTLLSLLVEVLIPFVILMNWGFFTAQTIFCHAFSCNPLLDTWDTVFDTQLLFSL